MTDIYIRKAPSHQVEWEPEDIKILKALAGIISKEKIAVILKTSVDRVLNKSATQGFKLRVKK